MELLGRGAINCMVYEHAVHASFTKRVCPGRAAFSFLRLSVLEMKKICLAWGLLLAALCKADFR